MNPSLDRVETPWFTLEPLNWGPYYEIIQKIAQPSVTDYMDPLKGTHSETLVKIGVTTLERTECIRAPCHVTRTLPLTVSFRSV